jgi:hypothetical protein
VRFFNHQIAALAAVEASHHLPGDAVQHLGLGGQSVLNFLAW